MTAARVRVALIGVAALALVLRAHPLLVPNGPVGSADYDEGVYVAAAGLLSDGAVPYRDFVLLHPPGLSLLLSPVATVTAPFFGWDGFLATARWLTVLVGTANVLLLFRVVARWRGPVAGLIAAVLCAGYPAGVLVDQHVSLEPFVVLALLLSATAWLSDPVPPRAGAATGVLLGAAGLFKLTGGLALLAVLASPRAGMSTRERLQPVLFAAGTAVAVVLPFAVWAGPVRMWEQLVVAQAERPGGDVTGGSLDGLTNRLAEVVRIGPLAASGIPRALLLLALVTFAAVLAQQWWRGGRDGKFWSVAFLALLLPPLLAPDWYYQYPVPAAVAAFALLGGTAAELLQAGASRRHVKRAVAVCLVLLLAAGTANVVRDEMRDRPTSEVDFTAAVGDVVPDDVCVAGVPPHLVLAAGRLPPEDRSGTHLVDPFGALLLHSLLRDVNGTTPALLTARGAQGRLRAALTACRYVALDSARPGSDPRFSPATVRWFTDRFHPVTPGSQSGPVLWEAVPMSELTD